MKQMWWLMGIIGVSGILYAGGPGTTAGISLLRSGDVRAAAMAGSASWLGGTAVSLYANPAGLVGVRGMDAAASYQAGFADTYFTTLNYAMRIGPATVGGALCTYNAGTIALVDSWGVVRQVSAINDTIVRIGGAIATPDDAVSFGTVVSFLSSRFVEEFNASAVALDAGVLIRRGGFSAGMALQNLGTKMKYDQDEVSIPIVLRVGAGYSVGGLRIGVDVSKEPETNIQEALGVEYAIAEAFHLRAGYRFGSDTARWTLGFGTVLGPIRMEYAFGFLADTAASHQVALGTSF